MKTLINIIILIILAGAGYYFYQDNKEALNKTLHDVKDVSVESVSESVMKQVKNIDTDILLELAAENKDELFSLIKQQDIKLENIDINSMKNQLKENGLDLEKFDFNNEENIAILKEIINKTGNK
ncbi:MAG: hypothetical protein OEY36_04235 [Gammaproteobacteria bacterium]|nr:hypothetical protein [Gammaproteobacteria bacterium]